MPTRRNKPVLLVILQNAWRANGERYSHKQWLEALWNSHTGRRLRNILPETPHTLYVANASPEIGKESSSMFPADIGYIKRQIARVSPDVIVACGQVASNAITEIAPDAICITAPHPAWRAYSKEREMQVQAQVESFVSSAYKRMNGNAR